MLRVLKQRTHFDLQPGYCSSGVEDRSDASHPYPFYPLPETVMSLESQETNNQNNTGHGVAPAVYQNFAHPNFYFPPTASVSAAKPSGHLQPPLSSHPLPPPPPPSPRQQQQEQQQPERLRQTEQAIYEKILKEANKGEKSNETAAANGSEESFESANQEPSSSEPMTNHSQGDERVATAQEASTAEEDRSNPTQLRGETAAQSAGAANKSSSSQMSPPSAQPMMSSPPPLMEVPQEPEDQGDKSPAEDYQDSASRRQSEDRSSEQFDPPQRSPSFEEQPLQIDEESYSGREDEMRSNSIEIKTEPVERQHSSPVDGVPNTVFPEPVSPVTRTPGVSPPIKQEQVSPSITRGPVSPALTRGTVSPALSSQDPVSPVVARGPPPLLLASHIDGDNVVYPPGSMSTPSKNQDGGLGSRPDLDASNSSFNSACGSLTPGGPGSDGEKQGDLYYCHLCTYVGMSKHHFQVHMNSHFEHSCPHCDYSSRTEGRLKRHIKDFHSEEPPDTFAGNKTLRGEVQQPGRPKIFRCRQCDFSAENKIEFWEHSRSHIKSDKILQCPKCPFVTEYKHHLEYHLRNHFGSKPFKCGKCNYACVNKSMLNSHMKSHTNVYQYRCADCTYATKYCHSLKLHLKKYNHQPATVLNIDGSLPTDGSGDFELVSKRGPPRGPRGPRKEGMAPSPGMTSPMLLPQTGLTGHSPLNGALFGPGFWPMNGLQPPPPLIPVSGMTPLSIHMPQDLGHKMAGAEKEAQQPHQQPGANNNHKGAGIDPSSSNQGSNPVKCNLCPFMADSYQGFTQHMLKVHAAAENQDLLNMFGIPPETLAERYSAKSGAPEVETSVPSSVYHQHTPSKVQDMTQTWAALHHLSNSAASIAAGSMKPIPSADTYQSLGKEPFGSSSSNKISSPQMAAQEAVRHHHRQRKESPLDLTKRRGGDLYHEYGGGQSHRGEIIDYSPGGAKRRYEAEREMEENGEERNTPPSGATSPAPPRKRSRKGKAYKLDTLCMKLQERYTGSPPPGYDEGNDDDYSDYSMEKDSDAVPGEESGPSSAEPHHSGQDSAMDSSEKEDAAPVDYRELHSSLSVLNNGVSSSVDQRYINPEMPLPDERKVARRIEFGQEQSPSGHRNGRLSDERSDGSPLTTEDQSGKGPRGNGNSYECHHCGIAFRDCIMYTMHMGYHGYQDPFKCNMCGQQSSNKVEFFLHIARTAHE